MRSAYLEVRRNGNAERVSLSDGAVTIGRSAENVLVIASDESMSRAHAVIERAATGWVVRDFGSANGTWVNGERVSSERILEPGDELVLGSTSVVFHGAGAGTPTTVSRAEPQISLDAVSPQPAPSAGGYLDISEEWGSRAPDPPPPPAPRRDDDATPAPAKASAPAATAPLARNRGRGHARGVARDIQVHRSEGGQVLTFRVDRYDQSGNRLAAVAVEQSGYRGGHLGDGEEVEVTGRWSRGTLRAKKIVNLSTNAEVSGMGAGTKVAGRVFGGFVIVFIVGCFAFVVVMIVASLGG